METSENDEDINMWFEEFWGNGLKFGENTFGKET